MRPIYTLLFALMWGVSFAQRGPLKVDQSTQRYASVADLARAEGLDYTAGTGGFLTTSVTGTVVSSVTNAAANTTTVLYSANVALSAATIPIGKAFVPSLLEFKADKKFLITYFTPSANVGAFVTYDFSFMNLFGEANERVTRPMATPVHARQRPINPTLTQITDVIAGTTPPGVGTTATIPFTYAYNITGHIMTDDLNLSATRYVDARSDSRGAGVGQTTTETMPMFLLREYWTDKGFNYRLRNQSISSTTTAQHLGYQQNGRYYTDAPKVILCELGTNSVAGGVPVATYLAEKAALIDKWIALYPGVKIIVPALTPRLLPASEALMVTARAAEKAQWETLKYGGKVFYIEATGTCFTATDATKYLGSDGAGGVHLVDATITGFYWPAVKTYLDSPINGTSGKKFWEAIFN